MSTHVARVAKIDAVSAIPNADRIQTAHVLGVQVIVNKDAKVGDVGILFDGELQLSEEYCHNNNLFRDKEKNIDKEKSGFFEENRRVRVQKFLKVKSEGLFMPLESVDFTGYDGFKLSLGDTFNDLNGIKICEKYISVKTRAFLNSSKNKQKKIKVVEAPLFKEHVDSEQLTYYIDSIPVGSLITIEHKWHGTSGRVTYTKTSRHLSKWKQWVNKRLPIFKNEQWEYLAGSRRVVLFPENSDKVGFHGPEKYRFDILEMFKPYLNKNMTIYFEIVGFVNGSPIMGKHDLSKLKDEAYTKKYGKEIVYKYGCLDSEYKVKIYRISITTEDGHSIDYSSQQVVEWCEKRGLLPSKPLINRFIYDGDKDKLLEIVKNVAERPEKLCEDYFDPSHINEGVVVRVDYGNEFPLFLKYKTFPFKVAEGIAKDTSIDIEDAS
jgi:hypothetical protein